jgi:hypothetical protein
MRVVAFITGVYLCFTLLGTGFAKLIDPHRTSLFLARSTRMDLGIARQMTRIVASFEILVAIAIGAAGRRSLVAIAGLITLSLGFILAKRFGTRSVTCGCLGGSEPNHEASESDLLYSFVLATGAYLFSFRQVSLPKGSVLVVSIAVFAVAFGFRLRRPQLSETKTTP